MQAVRPVVGVPSEGAAGLALTKARPRRAAAPRFVAPQFVHASPCTLLTWRPTYPVYISGVAVT